MQLTPRTYIITGYTRMGEQKVPYAGLSCESRGNVVSRRLYPHKRIVLCHNHKIVTKLPAIEIAHELYASWFKHEQEIASRLLEMVKAEAATRDKELA